MSPYKLSQTSPSRPVKALLLSLGIFMIMVESTAAATIGVGVGTGKINLDEAIKPSTTYKLPSIAVFNNGDTASDYEMSIEFNEVQSELKPRVEWFTFSPSSFNLEPGKSQRVDIVLRPEYSAKPGNYFAYLEAHPTKRDETGKTAIKVAAATKLSFRIVPANVFQRVYYLLLDFWNKYKAIILLVSGALVIASAVLLAKRFLNIEVKRKKQD
jgi:hypothetical protein